jgi:hypothetical protein
LDKLNTTHHSLGRASIAKCNELEKKIQLRNFFMLGIFAIIREIFIIRKQLETKGKG